MKLKLNTRLFVKLMAQKTPNLNVKNLIVEQNKSIKDALNNITTNGLGACF